LFARLNRDGTLTRMVQERSARGQVRYGIPASVTEGIYIDRP